LSKFLEEIEPSMRLLGIFRRPLSFGLKMRNHGEKERAIKGEPVTTMVFELKV